MSQRRRHLTYLDADSDTTFLAGWMYADLFLALMVVFLATISFVPEYLSSSSRVGSSYNYVSVYKEPLIVVYDSFDRALIKKDIEYFLKTRGLPNTTDVLYAQVIGGYAKNTEASTAAIDRALKFSQQLDASDIASLANVATTLSASSTLPPGRIAVKFSFAVNTEVTNKTK